MIGQKLRKFAREESGGPTIEFVIVFPTIMWLVMSVVETGFVATQMVMLERGLDVASRQLKLGTDPSMDHEEFKQIVCENAIILDFCRRDLILEVVELEVNSAYPQNQANCIDRSGEIEPKIDFNAGGRNRIMFVRACMVVDPLFPGMGITLGLRKDRTGGLQIVSYSAFMNEPP